MVRRTERPGPLARHHLAALRHSRNPAHLERCTECRAALKREREYLERLRGAAVPEASHELTARLLLHTQRLASEQTPASPAPRSGAGRTLRAAGIGAASLVISVGALGVAAYAVAGDDAPAASYAAGSGSSPLSAAVTGDVSGPVAHQKFSPGNSVALTAGQLDALRDQGWACPELESLGFTVVGAKATLHNGHPAVELRLESNGHYATVTEEHLEPSFSGGASSARLTVTQGQPWEAVYRTSTAVISYASDLPADLADDAVPELVRAGDSMTARTDAETGEEWPGRLLRGLQTLLRTAGL